MIRIAQSAVVSILLLLFAGAAPLAADSSGRSRDKRVEKSFAVQGRHVSLDSTASDITVIAVDGDQASLVVDLEFWSSDEEWMKTVESEFDVEMAESSSEVSLRLTEMPGSGSKGLLKRIFGGGETYYSVEIALQLPRGTDLSVENRYGDILVEQVLGPLKVVNTSGELTIEGVRGGADIENSYGDATITDVEGGLVLVVSSGTARVADATGDVKVSNRYGEVAIADVSGRAGSGDVE